jgi:hypothetical protein
VIEYATDVNLASGYPDVRGDGLAAFFYGHDFTPLPVFVYADGCASGFTSR